MFKSILMIQAIGTWRGSQQNHRIKVILLVCFFVFSFVCFYPCGWLPSGAHYSCCRLFQEGVDGANRLATKKITEIYRQPTNKVMEFYPTNDMRTPHSDPLSSEHHCFVTARSFFTAYSLMCIHNPPGYGVCHVTV